MREQCCGKERVTAFCPDCGKQMECDSPLREIHNYCKGRRHMAVITVNKSTIKAEEMLNQENGAVRWDVQKEVFQLAKFSQTVSIFDDSSLVPVVPIICLNAAIRF